MSALYWLLIPVGATLVAMVVAARLSRPRRFVEKYEQVEQFRRFCEAMEDDSTKRRYSKGEIKPITRAVE